MSIESDLLRLARDREAATDAAVDRMLLEAPDIVRRQLRAYLSRKVDCGRIERTDEKIPQLMTLQGGFSQLSCPDVQFSSGARLSFEIKLEEKQGGWLVRQFQFHITLARSRTIKMVRFHLNAATRHDPLTIPRCHLHIDNSEAHVPLPVMDPLLMVHIICEHVEPDFGT
ncbi:MAG: hypothetical protein WCB12_12600 [Bryobacteraceae bacterium]